MVRVNRSLAKYSVEKETPVVDTTDIEKKSLEAHVELCAERYRYLEDKLESVEEKLGKVDTAISEIKEMIQGVVTKRNDQIVGWGVGIIVTLLGIIGVLLTTYVIK